MPMLKYFVLILQKIIAILFYDIKYLNWYKELLNPNNNYNLN